MIDCAWPCPAGLTWQRGAGHQHKQAVHVLQSSVVSLCMAQAGGQSSLQCPFLKPLCGMDPDCTDPCLAVEHVACGSGLQNIYDFLREVNPGGRPHAELQQIRTPPEIGRAAMAEGDELCLEAVDHFLSVLGAEAAHMGLRLLSTGGVYIAGGTAA